jgi:hypothetical protein
MFGDKRIIRDISVLEEHQEEVGASAPLSFQVVWQSLVGPGMLDIQVSNDRVNWNSILDSVFDMSSDDNLLVLEPSTPYGFIRIFITGATSGTYSIFFNQK